MRVFSIGFLALLIAGPCLGAAPAIDLSRWLGAPPISFQYGGRSSTALLPTWKRTDEDRPNPSGSTHVVTFTDPAGGLVVTAEIRTFKDSEGIDWVLWFENRGATDTNFIDGIRPLDWSIESTGVVVVHHAKGSSAKLDDFRPLDEEIPASGTVRLESEHGLSSSGSTLPYFNLETGSGGVVGAIGWTGNWSAIFKRAQDGRSLAVDAGMKRTHLRLHPGERIRSPRIVLLPWVGADWMAAQNDWRRLVMAHYAPQAGGAPLRGPVMFGSWGSEPIADKLRLIHDLAARRMPFDTYAVDAGWYGNSRGLTEEESDHGKFPWWRQRGDWWPSTYYYPQGLPPLGNALREAGLGFSLWVEPETAEPGTQMLKEHPSWYLHVPNAINDGAALANLGDPAVRAGLTKLVSDLIDAGHLTWYRQDFNIPPQKYWELADSPDRIGMTEIRHIEGLYSFWDQLRSEHPGLAIDNCASGGRRLDLEMMSRSFVVWRSDFGCANPIAEQVQTQALAPWVPLNMAIETLWPSNPWTGTGPFGTAPQVYAMRLGYSAGYGSNPGPVGTANDGWFAFEKQALSEYREVAPYFYGDFYPMLPYSVRADAWTAWQWDRPDLGAGIVLLLRRDGSSRDAFQLALHGIDPTAQYEVEQRAGFGRARPTVMTGDALRSLAVTVASKPGSLLILYRRRSAPPQISASAGGGSGHGTILEISNSGPKPELVVFEPTAGSVANPAALLVAAGSRQPIRLELADSANGAIAYSVGPDDGGGELRANHDLYRAYRDGETEGIIPVAPELFQAVLAQVRAVLRDSRTEVTDPAMPSGTFIYTPSPYYRAAGVFGRDFLFQLEGSGRHAVSAGEVRAAVDFMALKQLRATHRVRDCTYPVGAIPDRVRPDGQIAWGPGPGDALGDRIGGYHRPSLDEALCFVTLAWHYGAKARWDDEWRQWFKGIAPRLEDAWNSVSRNPRSGLVTQWTTPGHVGAGGIDETNGPSVMWGFHDSYGFGGDDLGTSVLACNAARSLSDGYRHAGEPEAAGRWAEVARTLEVAIQAQFNDGGYLPWGVGPGAPPQASPDITGYAVWSGILTATQSDAASDWLAARYQSDRAQGGAADLFNMTPGLRGSVRMARKAEDSTPGDHVWPHVKAPYWENLTFGYNAYQDGGYWYYMSLAIAATLWRRHPEEAKEWARYACRDLVAEGGNYPYERVDGTTPVNFRYNASAGAVLGMVRPATDFSLTLATLANEPPPVH